MPPPNLSIFEAIRKHWEVVAGVIPAKAGIQISTDISWIPAFAGMTEKTVSSNAGFIWHGFCRQKLS